MPRTAFSITTLATACLGAACFAPPALAQGAIKPLEAVVVNPVSRPVPVAIIAPATPAKPQVICRLTLPQTSGSAPISGIDSANPVGAAVLCPAGVTRFDVQRIVLDPGVAQHHVMLALGVPQRPGFAPVDRMLGAVSTGTPDLSLGDPVRIDLTSPEYIIIQQVCSSGIASLPGQCGGGAYLIVTPVN